MASAETRTLPGELKTDSAQGSFTADADGIPLTYTTAPGDTERQIEARFKTPDLEWANRTLTGTDRVWYDFSDLPSGELAPGQTISLALNKPIHKRVILTWAGLPRNPESTDRGCIRLRNSRRPGCGGSPALRR
ncbi:hypothetical protein [Arthrobacter sp. H-02-3]|uniref:hypothetical protein n=1 Tax=Arthrobacter sp. H-02-3 TaxID=2703675 RepID=UPI000DD1C00D|nr:hypothetical protein [Arthrobacter sp. H-02-3]PVZ52497.1 hypothetical protein C9424_20000 [Arthrobacter sp. H-02-3]